MLQAMLIVMGVYLAGCYVYGMYLVVRLFARRRAQQAIRTPGHWAIHLQQTSVDATPIGHGRIHDTARVEPAQAA